MALKNKSGTSGAAAAVEATAMQRWWQLWQMAGGGSGISDGVCNGAGGTVAMVG